MYLDETWANARDSVEKMWVEDDPVVSGGTIAGVRKPAGKGNHLIILHAGGENGSVKSVNLVFQSKKATSDYHDEIMAVHFEEWFHDSLLLNLQSNSLIVMDNAPYHSHKLEPVPTMSLKKQQMQDWLPAKGIVFPECSLKRELLQLIVANP